MNRLITFAPSISIIIDNRDFVETSLSFSFFLNPVEFCTLNPNLKPHNYNYNYYYYYYDKFIQMHIMH